MCVCVCCEAIAIVDEFIFMYECKGRSGVGKHISDHDILQNIQYGIT